MSLLAPEIGGAANDLMTVSGEAFERALGLDTGEYETPYMMAYEDAITACRVAMSKVLL